MLWLLSINTDMLAELNRTKQANYQNQIMANFEQISQACGNFLLRLLLLQQLETYDSGSSSGLNIDTPAGVDSGTPVCVHLWLACVGNGTPDFTSNEWRGADVSLYIWNISG